MDVAHGGFLDGRVPDELLVLLERGLALAL
jgi:hypothetical protein